MPLPNKSHFHLPPIIHLRLSVDTTLITPPSHPPPIPSPPPPPPPPSPVLLPITRRHRPRQLRKLSHSHYWPPDSTQVPTTSAALQILGTSQDGALDEFVVNATRLFLGLAHVSTNSVTSTRTSLSTQKRSSITWQHDDCHTNPECIQTQTLETPVDLKKRKQLGDEQVGSKRASKASQV